MYSVYCILCIVYTFSVRIYYVVINCLRNKVQKIYRWMNEAMQMVTIKSYKKKQVIFILEHGSNRSDLYIGKVSYYIASTNLLKCAQS